MNWKNTKISEVAKEQIWKEHVKTESQYMNSKDRFSMNPYRLHKTKPMCDNVAKRDQFFLGKEVAMHGKAVETGALLKEVNKDITDAGEQSRLLQSSTEIHNSLLDARKAPVDKYPYPLTEAQEIGWVSRPLIPQKAEFNFSLVTSDVTKFVGDTKGGKSE